MSFPEYLRYWRTLRCMSQEKLAHAIGLTGQSAVGNYESGLKEPSIERLLAIAAALQVPVGALIDPAEFKAFRDAAPATDERVRQIVKDFMLADDHGKYVVETTARAVSQRESE